MLGLLVAVVVTVSAVWVYLDATKNGIGKQVDGSGFFNLSAGGWATVTLLLWIIAFPCYLVKREDLIWKAKKSPVVVSGRAWKALVLLAVGGYFIVGQAFFALSGEAVPAASSGAGNTADGPISYERGAGTQTAASPVPSGPRMTDAEIQQCRNLFEVHIRVAQSQARYLGEERATQQALQRIRESASDQCMQYAAIHFQ
jgi:hypothetical protein